MSDNAIELTHVKKQYDQKAVVDDVSFTVRSGEIFSLLGPNGAGKSTLIKMMTTLLCPDAGNITINGFNIRDQAQAARQQFSVTGQSTAIDQDLSARENLIIFGKLNGLLGQAARERADALLQDFDLVNSADKALATFSGGMRRRLDLAVSLIGKPDILFLDEPTTGLDPRTRIQMWTAIRKLVTNGSTVLLTTQFLEEADQLANRIALIDHGRLMALGTPDELKQQVGGMQLRITIADIKAVPVVSDFLQNQFGSSPTTDDATLTIPLREDAMPSVGNLLHQLQEANITINRMNIEPPSLDDVFFKMTVGKN